MRGFWCSGDSTSQRILDVLESFYLRLWKIIVQWVAVVKFRMNDRSGNGTGSFEVKIRTNTAKFTNMIIARFRESRYLVRKGEEGWSGILAKKSKQYTRDNLPMTTLFYWYWQQLPTAETVIGFFYVIACKKWSCRPCRDCKTFRRYSVSKQRCSL